MRISSSRLVAGTASLILLLAVSACSHPSRDAEADSSAVAGEKALARLSAKENFKRALDDIENKSLRDRMASGVLNAELLVYKELESRDTFRQALATIAHNRSVFRAEIKKEQILVESISSLKLSEAMSAAEIERAEAIKKMAAETHSLQASIDRDFLEVDRLVGLEGTGDSTQLASDAAAKIREANELATQLTTLQKQVTRAKSTF
jgi:hypothetical protein